VKGEFRRSWFTHFRRFRLGTSFLLPSYASLPFSKAFFSQPHSKRAPRSSPLASNPSLGTAHHFLYFSFTPTAPPRVYRASVAKSLLALRHPLPPPTFFRHLVFQTSLVKSPPFCPPPFSDFVTFVSLST